MKRPQLNTTVLGYSLLMTAGGTLAALALQVGSGAAPIPAEWAWAIPVLVQALFGFSMSLKSLVPDRSGVDPELVASVAAALAQLDVPRGKPAA